MEHRVISNVKKYAEKYAVTFVAFLLAVVFVIAVASLFLNRTREYWLSTDNGAGREAMFPLPFTDDDYLYVLSSDLEVVPVDNGTSNQVFDAELKRIYYISNEALYEYEISKNYRKLLCSGVKSFTIFEERTAVLVEKTDGSLGMYSYNSKKIEPLTQPDTYISEQNFELKALAGKALYCYSSQNADGSVALRCGKVSERSGVIAENFNADKPFCIWRNDSAVSYYAGNDLNIYNTHTDKTTTIPGGVLIMPTVISCAENVFPSGKEYNSCVGCGYVLTADGLKFVNPQNRGTSVSDVAENVKSIIAFDDDKNVVIYEAWEDNSSVLYLSQKGGKSKKITVPDGSDSFVYEPDSGRLFMTEQNGRVSYVDVNDTALKTVVVTDTPGTVAPYARKPFAVITDYANNLKTIVISANEVEKYQASEYRLYGKSNDKYLVLRETGTSGVLSLDLTDEEQITRISGKCTDEVIFDKKLETVVYRSGERLYIFANGKSAELPGEYGGEISAVPVLAKKK